MFRCPVCRCGLQPPDAVSPDAVPRTPWTCPSGHAFDVAREGYVNLLITHQRRQREPGDSAEMLQHRRRFLDAGHYGPLAETLAELARPGLAVLDAGCGEGYYTRRWPDEHEGLEVWAVDIAKSAVRAAAKRTAAKRSAAKRARGLHYAVASVYDLPVVDASIDLALSVFAPLHSPEFERVLRPGGRLVTVTPGPDHLDGLKAKLFAEPESHPERGPFDGDDAQTALVPAGSRRLRYDLELRDAGAVADLLNMTPYAWYVSPEVRLSVVSEGSLSTAVDFLISSYEFPL